MFKKGSRVRVNDGYNWVGTIVSGPIKAGDDLIGYKIYPDGASKAFFCTENEFRLMTDEEIKEHEQDE